MFSLKNSFTVKWIFTACAALSMTLLALPAYTEDSGKLSSGENVYTKICGHCHDVGIGPVIKGRQLPPEYISYVVRHGLRAMPAFPEPYISNEDLQYLGQYVQQSVPEKK